MSIKELHEITGELIAKNNGDAEVAIDHSTFIESENGSILTVEKVELKRIRGADDSGPVGPKFPFLVLSGPMEWHTSSAAEFSFTPKHR